VKNQRTSLLSLQTQFEEIPMRNTIAGAAAVLLATTVAGAAADLMPLKAPPVPYFTWDGFYLGVNVGYGWSENQWTSQGILELPGAGTSNFDPKTNHVLGGVQAGANYQFGTWVAGFEADVMALGARESASGNVFVGGVAVPGITATATTDVDWLALFTGRLGWAWDRALLYVKGGVAAGQTKDNFNLSAPGAFIDFGTKTNVLVGGTIGAGIEYAFAPHWTAKIEYNWVDLGSNTENFNVIAGGASLTSREEIEHKISILKFGANYKF
jgi:outer membrane immunogenic protein